MVTLSRAEGHMWGERDAMVRTLGGRYRLTDFLASGRTGEVWRALDRGTDRLVAVKLLYPHLASDVRLAERFERSRGELTALWHPCIARLLDVVVDPESLGLVTDLVPGTDLGRRLAGSRPVTAGTAAQIGSAVADALSAAHRLGVVHGDLKPSNILIPPPGEGPARVTDFAVASLVRSGRGHSQPVDRSPYLAPEVIEGAAPGAPSDVYALGAVLAEMLSHNRRTRSKGDEYAVSRLRELAAACMLTDPGARPSAADAGRELRDLLPHLGVGSVEERPASTTHRASAEPRRARRRKVWLIRSPLRLALVLLTAMAVTLGVIAATRTFWVPQGSAQESPRARQTESPPGSAPALPGAAQAHTKQGGTEFVRYWFAALTYAAQTGDTTELAAATSQACGSCQAAIRTIRSTYDDGGSMRGGAYLIRNVSTDSLFTLDNPVYGVTLDRTARVSATGALPTLSFANCVVILEWTGKQWRVLEVPTAGCVA